MEPSAFQSPADAPETAAQAQPHELPPFLDVPALLESSQPRARVGWFWYAAGGFLLVVLLTTLASSQSETGRRLVDVLSAVLMLALIAGMLVLTVLTVRRHRAEQQQVEAAAELVQLRRWPQAAMLLEQILSRPARTGGLRSQALIYLAAVLARYHRFDDAIAVHNHLLEHNLVDPSAAHGLRLGRAMAMLREDHLFDADRAISELRRTTSEAGVDSAGLALVEMFRDVRTGHPAEAAAIFEEKLPALRDALGHRVADAYALAARAYDLLGRATEAQDAYTKATLLSPLTELHRRYPEVEKLFGRLRPEPAPPEAA
jgi:tetratricopeptide (TPR) repeat protein